MESVIGESVIADWGLENSSSSLRVSQNDETVCRRRSQKDAESEMEEETEAKASGASTRTQSVCKRCLANIPRELQTFEASARETRALIEPLCSD